MKKELAGWLYNTITGTTTYTVGANSYNWATLTGSTGSTHITKRCIPAYLLDTDAPMECNATTRAFAAIEHAGTTPQEGRFREDDETYNVHVFAAKGDTERLADVAQYIKYAIHGNTQNDKRYKELITPWRVGRINVSIGAAFVNNSIERHQVTLTITFDNVYQNGG